MATNENPRGGRATEGLQVCSTGREEHPVDTQTPAHVQAPCFAYDNFFLKHADTLAVIVWCDDRAEMWERPVQAADAGRFTITLFPNQYASSMRFASTTLRELGDRIQRTSARSKESLPFVKFAHFGNERSNADCLRHDHNVISINGCELDYDEKKVPFETAVDIAKKANLHCLIYTSASHTEDKPKWRIVCRASEAAEGDTDYLRDTRAKWAARVNGIYGGIFAPESFVLSQSYYFGSVKGNPPPRVAIVEGDYIDRRPDLDANALGKDRKPANAGPDHFTEHAEQTLHVKASYSELLGPILSGDNYNQKLIRFVSKLAAAGTDENSIVDLAQGVMELSKGPRDARWQDRFDDIPRYVASAVKKFSPEAAPAKPDACPSPVDLWANFAPPELPTGVLPELIEKFARIEGAAMGADPAGLAGAALTVCAAAISDEIQIKPKRHSDWKESPRLWAALVGDPSTMKTPSINQAAWPLKRIDKRLFQQYLADLAAYDALPPEERKTTEPPKQKRVRIEDTTIEAAQEVLKDSPDGVLCLQDELSGWFGMMDRYNGNRGGMKDRGFWLQAWNGGEYVLNRVGRGAVFIPKICPRRCSVVSSLNQCGSWRRILPTMDSCNAPVRSSCVRRRWGGTSPPTPSMWSTAS
jgi:hypothetical protein